MQTKIMKGAIKFHQIYVHMVECLEVLSCLIVMRFTRAL